MQDIGTHESFIVFGCWNKYTDIDGDLPVKKVTDKIKGFLQKEDNNPKFLVIAGDNYYPLKEYNQISTKKTGNKIINPNRLRYGFELLPKDITTYMILGNHDLETALPNKHNIYTDDTSLESPGIIDTADLNTASECAIIEHEMNISRSLHSETGNFFFEFNKSELICNTLVLMIDTSIYDDDARIMLPCYAKFMNQLSDITIDSLLELQWQFIHTEIEKHSHHIDNIVFIGHHPITGYKYKNNKIKLIEPSNLFIDVLYSVFRLYSNVKYYYICADLHNYQIGTVTIESTIGGENMTINQYIVGTGGTDLDTDPLLDVAPFPVVPFVSGTNRVHYSMTDEEKHICKGVKYGFLECICNNDKLSFIFNQVDGNPLIERAFMGGTIVTSKKKRTKKKKKRTKKKRTKKKK